MKKQICVFAGFCLVAGQPAAADTPAKAVKGPVPLGKLSSWITDDDYPRLAILQNRQGDSRFRLMIDRTGHVQYCAIVATSGSDDLDARACFLLEVRAQFEPAINASGEPEIGSYRSTVRWRLPHVSIPNNVYSVSSYVVEIDGSLSHCQIEKAAEGQQGIPRPVDCSNFGPLSFGYRDSENRLVRKQIVTKTTVTMTDVGPNEAPAPNK